MLRRGAELLARFQAPRTPPRPPPDSVSRISIFRTGRLGDIFLTDPLVAALEDRFSEAVVELLVDDDDPVPPWPARSRRVHVHRLALRSGPHGWRRPYDPEQVRSFDALKDRWTAEPPQVLLMANRLTDPVLRFLAARLCALAPADAWKAGLTGGGRRFRWLHRSLGEGTGHEIQRLLTLAGAVGADPEFRLPRVEVTADPPPRRPPGGEPRVVIHPGASRKSRIWPPDRWAMVVHALKDRARVIAVGSPAEKDLVRDMAVDWTLPTLEDRVGDTDVDGLARILGRADLFVGADSFPFHLAVALGRPALILPSPGDARYRGYPVGRVVLMGRHAVREWTDAYMSDRPNPALLELKPDEVIEAIVRELDRPSSPG